MKKRSACRYYIAGIVLGIMGIALSCSDTITGGRGITRQSVTLQATEIICPSAYNTQTLYPGNRAFVIFTEVSGVFACTTWTNDSSKATVQLVPGRYVVTAETGRGNGIQEMLDTLWVVPGDFTVVGSSDSYRTVPRMRDEDSMLVIRAGGSYWEPDLIIASYFYRNPSDSMGIEAEQGYIELLNEKIGEYLVTDSMQRTIHESIYFNWIGIDYSIPTTRELFVWRIQLLIDSMLTQFSVVTLQLNVVQQALRHCCVAVSRGSCPTFWQAETRQRHYRHLTIQFLSPSLKCGGFDHDDLLACT
jgi:hypothetical protein